MSRGNSNPVRGTLKPASTAGFIIHQEKRTRFRTFFKTKIKQAMASVPYKIAKLNNSKADDWFVYYSYINPETGKFERFKERFGLNNMNRLQHLADSNKTTVDKVRVTMAQEMIGVINDELKKGFNPFLQKSFKDIGSKSTVLEILAKLIEDLCAQATANQKETYRLMLSRFKKFVTDKRLEEYPASFFSIDHAKAFQRYLKEKMNLSEKTIKATMSHVGLFWDELIELKYVIKNPFRNVKPLKIRKQKADDIYEPLTQTELDQIVKAFRENEDHAMILFMGFVYFAWVRPVEISRLRIGDIDVSKKTIRFKASNTKNAKPAVIQIVPELTKLIAPLKLNKVQNQSWYLFSKNMQPGPDPIRSIYDTVTFRKWNPVCKKLKIKKALYSLKHTGNIEYLLQNKGKVDLKWQQMQNRHSSAAQTEQYNRKLGAYFIDLDGVKFRSF